MRLLLRLIIWTWLPGSSHSLPCNVSLAESCPASLYYVPRTMKTLNKTLDSISLEFGSFIVKNPGMALITPQTMTLDVIYGCFGNASTFICKVTKRDTLYTICL
ncbi:hypothetical protein ES332_D06G124800v1 [Gossypium tomentosum]|uniref:Xylanase inhibitor C-terminal domain-containing protein n=1 Tax=Gossypium tomentosum TaxID=34277 RepID=A0A5D2KI79_GOSTO|nr:hypothetical protein ES332_D06G124800v1 [Gossypium tomentosum]